MQFTFTKQEFSTTIKGEPLMKLINSTNRSGIGFRAQTILAFIFLLLPAIATAQDIISMDNAGNCYLNSEPLACAWDSNINGNCWYLNDENNGIKTTCEERADACIRDAILFVNATVAPIEEDGVWKGYCSGGAQVTEINIGAEPSSSSVAEQPSSSSVEQVDIGGGITINYTTIADFDEVNDFGNSAIFTYPEEGGVTLGNNVTDYIEWKYEDNGNGVAKFVNVNIPADDSENNIYSGAGFFIEPTTDVKQCDVIRYNYKGVNHRFGVEQEDGVAYQKSINASSDDWATATVRLNALTKYAGGEQIVDLNNIHNKIAWHIDGGATGVVNGNLEIDNISCGVLQSGEAGIGISILADFDNDDLGLIYKSGTATWDNEENGAGVDDQGNPWTSYNYIYNGSTGNDTKVAKIKNAASQNWNSGTDIAAIEIHTTDLKQCPTIQYKYKGVAHTFGIIALDNTVYLKDISSSVTWTESKVQLNTLKVYGNGDLFDIDNIKNAIQFNLKGNGDLEIDDVMCVFAQGEEIEEFESGDGSEQNPYLIVSKEQLKAFASMVNAGNSFENLFIRLGADIVLNDPELNGGWENWGENGEGLEQWIPIGVPQIYYPNTPERPFKGLFDGNGHVISGMYISNASDYQGLFGLLKGEDGLYPLIMNLGVVNSYIKGKNNVGGIVGYSGSYTGVINSYFNGIVSGQMQVGGLIGYLDGQIQNNYSTGKVTGTGSDMYVGGLVGQENWADAVINSYYNSTTSGRTDTGKGVGKTTEEMQSPAFAALLQNGEDFGFYWTVDGAKNSGYPYLESALGKTNIAGAEIALENEREIVIKVNDNSWECEYQGICPTITTNISIMLGEEGKESKPAVMSVKSGTATLTEGTDYEVNYSGNVLNSNAGTGTYCEYGDGQMPIFENGIVVEGGCFTMFNANECDLEWGKVVNECSNWNALVTNNVLIGKKPLTPQAVISGINDYYGSVVKGFVITGKRSVYGTNISVGQNSQVTITDYIGGGTMTLIEGTDYTVGTENGLTVITGKGIYQDSKSIATSFARGDGTEENPFIIENKPQLEFLANQVNVGNSYQGKFIRLGADIVLNDPTKNGGYANWGTNNAGLEQWTAIGNYQRPFKGIFNGNGYRILGLYINNGSDYQGLFGGTQGGTIENLGVIGYVKGGDYVGGISSEYGTFNNSYFIGNVSGTNSSLGGIAGNANSANNCYFVGTISRSNGGGMSPNNGMFGTASSGNIKNSFYNSVLLATSSAGTGKTTAEMKNIFTYILSGWDFANTWAIDPEVNDGYPFIINQNYNNGKTLIGETEITFENQREKITGGSADSYECREYQRNCPDTTYTTIMLGEEGKESKPGIIIKHNGADLISGEDYEISYANNVFDASIEYKEYCDWGGNCEEITPDYVCEPLGGNRVTSCPLGTPGYAEPIPISKAIIIGKNGYYGAKAMDFIITDKRKISEVTIEPIPEQLYKEGEPAKPKVVVKDNFNGATVILLEGVDYTISYSGNATVGRASARISGISTGIYENDEAQIVAFDIVDGKKFDGEIVIDGQLYESDESYIYTGNEIKPKIEFIHRVDGLLNEGEDYTIAYYCDDENGSDKIPCDNINAGYKYIEFTGIGDYKGTVMSQGQVIYGRFTIAPKQLELSMATIDEWIYEGVPAEPIPQVKYNSMNLILNEDFVMLGHYDNDAPTTDVLAMAYIEGTGNYTGEIRVPFSIIDPSSIVVTNIEVEWNELDFTYNGEAQKPTATAEMPNGFVLTVEGEQTDAGTYTATASMTPKSQRFNLTNATTEFTIAKAALPIATITVENVEHGEVPAPQVAGNLGEGEVTYLYSVAEDGEYTQDVPTELGTHFVKAEIAESGNYLAGKTNPVSFEITKPLITVTWTMPTEGFFTYNGKKQGPSATAKTVKTGAAVEVEVIGWQTNAGENSYIAEAKSDDYEIVSGATRTFSIKPKELGIYAVNPIDNIKQGDDFPTVTVMDGETELEEGTDYDIAFACGSTVITTTGNPCNVTATVTGKGNYVGTSRGQFGIFELAAIPVYVQWDYNEAEPFIYNREKQGPNIVAIVDKDGNPVVGLTADDFSIDGNEQINASENYLAIAQLAEFNPAYIPQNNTCNYKISKKVLNIVWSDEDFIYNGTAQGPTASLEEEFAGVEIEVSNNEKINASNDYTAMAQLTELNDNIILTNDIHSYSIAKKELTVVWSEEREFTYNKKVQHPQYSIANSNEIVDELDFVLTNVYSEADEYKGDIRPLLSINDQDPNFGNYLLLNNRVEYTIKKKELAVDFVVENSQGYEYNATADTLFVSSEAYSDSASMHQALIGFIGYQGFVQKDEENGITEADTKENSLTGAPGVSLEFDHKSSPFVLARLINTTRQATVEIKTDAIVSKNYAPNGKTVVIIETLEADDDSKPVFCRIDDQCDSVEAAEICANFGGEVVKTCDVEVPILQPEFAAGNSFRIWQNASGIMSLDLGYNPANPVLLEVRNMQGKLVASERINSRYANITLNASNGMYVFKVGNRSVIKALK